MKYDVRSKMMAQKKIVNGGNGARRPIDLARWKDNTRGPALEIHWSDVDEHRRALAIDSVTRGGGAIMFGRTSDGGALSLVVLHGTAKIKEYPHTAEEAAELIDWLVDEFTS